MTDRDHLIFVNYRGSDEIWATEFVYARMTEAFGEETVFKAGNALRPGDMFSPVLLEKAARCPVMLACVGPAWLTAQDPDGRSRLDSPEDWVRREIVLSLQAGNRVVPLLLGDRGTVTTPQESELPPDLRTLFGHQAWRLTPGGGLDLTVPRLIEKLVEMVPELGTRRRAAAAALPQAEQAQAEQARARGAARAAANVHNEISGGTYHGPTLMGRDFTGDMSLGSASSDTGL